MFERINLHRELEKERERLKQQEDQLLKQANVILHTEADHDGKIQQRIINTKTDKDELSIANVDKAAVFSLKEIHAICTRYRLRFLETKYLRYPLPYEAFIHIKEFEKQQQVEIKQFSIMAPAEAFKLNKKTDPLLFAHLGNNRYYLLYQWGNDLSWHRAMRMLPLRNLYTLFVTIILTSFVIAFFIPKEWMVTDENLYPFMYNFRLFLFFLLSTGSAAALFYIGLTRNKSFSEDAWNSKWI